MTPTPATAPPRHVAVLTRTDRQTATSPAALAALVEELDTRCEPIVHLATGTTIGHEVLATRRASSGPAAPLGPTLVALELMGSIGPVTDRMLRSAGRLSCGVPGQLHVNVSASDMSCPSLPERIARSWPERDRTRLVLEVTEHCRLTRGRTLAANLAWLRGQGIAIAVDDFGDGHADDRSVALLLPGVIKVSAVGLGLGGRWSDRTCRALAGVVRHLDGFGATTVVEGIENASQREAATQCGFDLAQGHLFTRDHRGG